MSSLHKIYTLKKIRNCPRRPSLVLERQPRGRLSKNPVFRQKLEILGPPGRRFPRVQNLKPPKIDELKNVWGYHKRFFRAVSWHLRAPLDSKWSKLLIGTLFDFLVSMIWATPLSNRWWGGKLQNFEKFWLENCRKNAKNMPGAQIWGRNRILHKILD